MADYPTVWMLKTDILLNGFEQNLLHDASKNWVKVKRKNQNQFLPY